jgi:hypothetical protein
MDEPVRIERTPFNNRADFNEVDQFFRKRLESMVPSQLSKRIQEILSKRQNEQPKVEET